MTPSPTCPPILLSLQDGPQAPEGIKIIWRRCHADRVHATEPQCPRAGGCRNAFQVSGFRWGVKLAELCRLCPAGNLIFPDRMGTWALRVGRHTHMALPPRTSRSQCLSDNRGHGKGGVSESRRPHPGLPWGRCPKRRIGSRQDQKPSPPPERRASFSSP